MTPKQIILKREKLKDKIHNAMEALKDLQDICIHPSATHVNSADTVNWCKDDDSYWTEHWCVDCGKKWQTDQNWNKK